MLVVYLLDVALILSCHHDNVRYVVLEILMSAEVNQA